MIGAEPRVDCRFTSAILGRRRSSRLVGVFRGVAGISKVWPILIPTGIISVILAYVCYRRQASTGCRGHGGWTIFVCCSVCRRFRLPGPTRVAGPAALPALRPACPRDRPACFACNHDFPPPPAKGIEVFA